MKRLATAWASRPLRRLALALLWLLLLDPFVPSTLESLEYERYERGAVFRFENSDLFGLGPLVEYLREHPQGERPRTLFFGNSVVWGYGLAAETALPARFQQLHPGSKVFNIAINGFDTGSSYLIARAVIHTVDRLYVLRKGEAADPMLPSLIPVSDEDAQTFGLSRGSHLEGVLQQRLRMWRLYRYSYRLQAAFWGSSTRQYIYLHKGDLARKLIARLSAAARQQPEDSDGPAVEMVTPLTELPLAASSAADLENRHPLMWRFASLAREHRKRMTFLHVMGYSEPMSETDIAAFNGLFAPFAEITMVHIPRTLTFDGLHLTAEGARAFAEALSR